jgi:hypothetical protein
MMTVSTAGQENSTENTCRRSTPSSAPTDWPSTWRSVCSPSPNWTSLATASPLPGRPSPGKRSGHFGFTHSIRLQGTATLPRYGQFLPPFPPWGQPNSSAAYRRPGGHAKVLTWLPNMTAAFTNAKATLVAAVPLAHPLPGAVLSLATDASDTHVGVVLQQQVGHH